MDSYYKVGDKVSCNGNPNGVVIKVDYWDEIYFYTIRLWDGFRLVGEVCTGESSLRSQNNAM